ncbi:hypothetical protein H257_11990 [Aphanomyces astaci]|uniref:Uncharacterized protein n=1 Tax=Aphanomyces astaci TaxID=112090 RepID=W4G2A5_APHAT|nr:hypothetical protein H257_11990 [Aphanomyces astaci]ETV73174.1 hypothetical protein H257_11990 [Aphanomyces astaci]|eukprot:XP_009837379.1 hypothetical protein H257_11990 [Aphanomyces astaci]
MLGTSAAAWLVAVASVTISELTVVTPVNTVDFPDHSLEYEMLRLGSTILTRGKVMAPLVQVVPVDPFDIIKPSALAAPLDGCPALTIANDTSTTTSSSYRLAMLNTTTTATGDSAAIPAISITNKDATALLRMMQRNGSTVVVQLRWAEPKASDHVDIALYTSSTSSALMPLLASVASVVSAFVPSNGCDTFPLNDNCPSLCMDNMFCTYDPDNDPDSGYSGAVGEYPCRPVWQVWWSR